MIKRDTSCKVAHACKSSLSTKWKTDFKKNSHFPITALPPADEHKLFLKSFFLPGSLIAQLSLTLLQKLTIKQKRHQGYLNSESILFFSLLNIIFFKDAITQLAVVKSSKFGLCRKSKPDIQFLSNLYHTLFMQVLCV